MGRNTRTLSGSNEEMWIPVQWGKEENAKPSSSTVLGHWRISKTNSKDTALETYYLEGLLQTPGVQLKS